MDAPESSTREKTPAFRNLEAWHAERQDFVIKSSNLGLTDVADRWQEAII